VLARLEQGDPSALGEIYDQHHEAIRAFAARLLGDRASAEDLVHEVFVQLPRVASRFRGESSLRTFLTGIAVNRARHFVRAAARRRAATSRMLAEPPSSLSAGSPEDEHQRREVLEAVTRCLDKLPLDQRIAFVLCDVEERTSKEASEVAGCPEATIRTRLFHARKKLRILLSEEGIQ
jgi:RNA polymerase sigma-70 factor (ECF subfamily)